MLIHALSESQLDLYIINITEKTDTGNKKIRMLQTQIAASMIRIDFLSFQNLVDIHGHFIVF